MKITVKSIGTDLFMGVLRIDIRMEQDDRTEDYCYFYAYGQDKKYLPAELELMVAVCKQSSVFSFLDIKKSEPVPETPPPTIPPEEPQVPPEEPTTTTAKFVLFDKTQQDQADIVRNMIAAKYGNDWRQNPARVKIVNAFILAASGKYLFWNEATKELCPDFLEKFNAQVV